MSPSVSAGYISSSDAGTIENLIQNDDLRQNEVDARVFTEGFNPETEIFYLLYTRNNRDVPQSLVINDTQSFKTSRFDPQHEIR